ncbi:MAG TPA: hypothetical protein VK689_13890, partial [Armatimonadota bacterium]|nr:hypothetical protein [Armatimonadota bacterium]
KLGEVVADLAAGSDALARANARGFQLLRSATGPFDFVGQPPLEVVQAYLKGRPAVGAVVPLARLSELAPLSPLQLSVLQRSNWASEEARVARELFAVLRFYRALSPAQRAALYSEAGLDVAGLTHAQLHALLDDKNKRGGFEVHSHLQEIRGLRFRFEEEPGQGEEGLTMRALRDGKTVSETMAELPVVAAEEGPVAQR